MKIKYDLSAAEILEILGGHDSKAAEAADTYIKEFERQYKITVPVSLKAFMAAAVDNPLLKTADIWINSQSLWTFLYHEIVSMNEEEAFYPEFINVPREQWSDMVADYLEIGSDFGAGVATFGICVSDLDKEDPPVYMNHEANEIEQWDKMWDTVSDYLLTVTCDALIEAAYGTAGKVLRNRGWKTAYYDIVSDIDRLLSERGIETDKLPKIQSIYVADQQEEYSSCCYDCQRKELYLFHVNKGAMQVWVISQ